MFRWTPARLSMLLFSLVGLLVAAYVVKQLRAVDDVPRPVAHNQPRPKRHPAAPQIPAPHDSSAGITRVTAEAANASPTHSPEPTDPAQPEDHSVPDDHSAPADHSAPERRPEPADQPGIRQPTVTQAPTSAATAMPALVARPDRNALVDPVRSPAAGADGGGEPLFVTEHFSGGVRSVVCFQQGRRIVPPIDDRRPLVGSPAGTERGGGDGRRETSDVTVHPRP